MTLSFRITGVVRGTNDVERVKARIADALLSLGPAYEEWAVTVRDPNVPLMYECTGCLHTELSTGVPYGCRYCDSKTFRPRDDL